MHFFLFNFFSSYSEINTVVKKSRESLKMQSQPTWIKTNWTKASEKNKGSIKSWANRSFYGLEKIGKHFWRVKLLFMDWLWLESEKRAEKQREKICYAMWKREAGFVQINSLAQWSLVVVGEKKTRCLRFTDIVLKKKGGGESNLK